LRILISYVPIVFGTPRLVASGSARNRSFTEGSRAFVR
jgi:hypothetical protein